MKRTATTSRLRRPTGARHRGRGRASTTARRAARPGLVVTLVLSAGLSLGGVAAAFFTSDGTGEGSVTTGTLEPPTDVAATSTPGTGDVEVSWTASAGGSTPDGYRVQRVPVSGPPVDACGTSASATTVATSCTDEDVPLGSHTYLVTAVRASWTAAATPSDAVVVSQATQAISFTSEPTDPTYGGPTYTVAADGGASGNPVTFTSDTPAVCTSSGPQGATISFVGAGTCTVLADQAGSTYNSAAPQATQSFVVAKAAQAITFTSTAPADAVVGAGGYQPTATGGASGNPVVFTVNATTSANCALSGGSVTYLKAGTCTIDADQAGDADHAAAPTVQQSFAISPAAQAVTITSTPPTGAEVGDSYALTATGGASGNPVVLATTSPSACSVSPTGPGAATVTFTAQGSCTLTADQAGNADYLAAAQVTQSIAVTRKAQAITGITTPTAPTYLGGYTTAATGGGSGNPVTFSTTTPSVCTSSGTNGTTISFVGAGTCTVTADQAGNTTWAPAPTASVTFTVARAAQSVTFNPSSPVTAGGSPVTLTASSTSSLTTFTFATSSPSSICTVSGSQVTYVGAGTCQLTASQAGNANYLPGSASANVTVNAAGDTTNPTIGAIEPGNETGLWSAISCSQPGTANRICVTASDNVGVTSVTIKLTKSGGRCWNGTSNTGFDTASCSTPVTLTGSGGTWSSAALGNPGNNGAGSFTLTTYTLDVTVKDAAGNTATATRSFQVTGY